MCRIRYRLVAAAALLVLNACGEVPHPFEDDKLGPHADLLAIPDAPGVVVETVEGVPAGAGTILAEAMAEALRRHEVLASTAPGNARSFHLQGLAEASANGVELHWSMRNAAGIEIGSDSQHIAVPLGEFPDDQAPQVTAALGAAASAAAPELAELIENQAPKEREPSRHLLVRDVEGAPGDGSKSLKRALLFLLKRDGTALTDDASRPDTVTIAGTVDATPAASAQDHLKIQWHVLAPDGSEAGVVSQENDVPVKAIEGQWGDLAMAVATAAAPDITRVAATVLSSPALAGKVGYAADVKLSSESISRSGP
jgi:hypothetical protein